MSIDDVVAKIGTSNTLLSCLFISRKSTEISVEMTFSQKRDLSLWLLADEHEGYLLPRSELLLLHRSGGKQNGSKQLQLAASFHNKEEAWINCNS